MKLLRLSLIVVVCGFVSLQSIAQVQTARFISMAQSSNGFYEYLPQGYNTSQRFPLILFIHGLGELGNGGSDLPSILNNGIPRLINQGTFPNSFTVNGVAQGFIVISPQFTEWPDPTHINAILDYVVQHYSVNTTRIYMTGLSMGGGVTWDYAGDRSAYAQRLAAIVPVCGASWPDATRSNIIAASDLPVWATHNQTDPTVPSSYTNDYFTLINSSNPTPLAKKTIFPVSGHNAWTTTYSPTFRENGMNIYEWMLQYTTSGLALPVTLTEYSAFQSGKNNVTVNWVTGSEQNNQSFTIERSQNGVDFSQLGTTPGSNLSTGSTYKFVDDSPLPGNNFYRLVQTDKDGTVTKFAILKVNISSAIKQSFVIKPNPVASFAMLELKNDIDGPLKISLSDLSGKTLQEWKFQKQGFIWQYNLPMINVPSGTYTLRIEGKGFREVQKIIKQ